MSYTNIIKYLAECYKADNHGTTIWNIFDNEVQRQYFFKENEVLQLSGDQKIQLNRRYSVETKNQAYLYQKEKQLFYCSFFVIGKVFNQTNDSKNICSPLFFYPAKIIEENNEFYLTIRLEDRILNTKLILTIIDDISKLSDFYEEYYQKLNKKPIDEENINTLKELLEKYFMKINTSILNEYPVLSSREELSNELDHCYQYRKNFYKIFPGSSLALLYKSNETRGIIQELTDMEEITELSVPLQLIFESKINSVVNKSYENMIEVPTILSESQHKILEASSVNPITLVIGPPGTGKTYTIAAIALEHLSLNKSILISSKNYHPINLISEQITDQLQSIIPVINAANKEYIKDCISYIDELLSEKKQIPIKFASDEKYKKLIDELDILNKKIVNIENEFKKRNIKEDKWGKIIAKSNDNKLNIFNQIRSLLINFEMNTKSSHSKLIKSLEEALKDRIKNIIGIIEIIALNQLRDILVEKKDLLNTYLQNFKKKAADEQINLFDMIDYKLLLKIFPIWIINTNEVFNIIPLEKELFDIAIIDEATQCDIASCIPILQRAKKVVIVGDPMQLRHLSFFSKTQQELIANQYELSKDISDKFNYRDKSIIDLANDIILSKQEIMILDEHYRSVPQIINFSNQEFYDNSLKIKSEVSSVYKESYIDLKYCDGAMNENNKNYKEALLLIDDVIKLIVDERSLNDNLCHSIGILSPFRNQIDYIFELLSEKMDIDSLKKHNVLAGTAHTFQGDERDVMFISFALDKNSPESEYIYLNKPDVFNVSITRARSAQYIYSSVRPKEINKNSLFKRYLENIEKLKDTERNDTSYATKFLDDVRKELNAIGIKVHPAFSLSGLKIDLVIEYSGKTFGVDLLGFPGIYNPPLSVNRYKIAHRAGLSILPLTYSNWYLNKRRSIHEIQKLIGIER